jgi:predicted PurR-regulated permease PerM
MPFSELTSRQKRVVAAAVTILSLAVILAAVGGTFWLVARFLRTFSGVFLPLAVAGAAALVLRPYFDFLRLKLRLPTALAIVALFVSLLLPIAAFSWFFGSLIAKQIGGMIAAFPDLWRRLQEQYQQNWPHVVAFFEDTEIGRRLRDVLLGQKDTLAHGLQVVGVKALTAGAGIARWFGTLAGWVVTPVYFVFFLVGGSRPLGNLEEHLPFLKPDTRKDAVFLIKEFVGIVVAFFRGQLIVALCQGMLFAIGFTLVGLKFGFVLGLLLGFLNIIPYLGSLVGLGINLPLAYFQEGGGWGTVVAVLIVFAIVQVIEAYVLTPRIMGSRTGLHPMAIIVAIFFWGSALDGILGLILAIPITAFLVVFWRLVREKYVGEWV